MNTEHPPAIFLMGPTATGKTEAAVYLAEHFPCEIISVDSALVYRGLNIGSAKPDAQTLQRAPHRLIDICDPAESYSAANFREDALREMEQITAAGRIPLLVGGTMLYFKVLRDGIADLPETDPQVREEVMAEAAREGWPAMHAKLEAVDPITAERLHPNHSQRIGRALEVYRMTGTPLSAFHAKQQEQSLPYRLLQLGLHPNDREGLHRRIDQRLDQMMDLGFLAEVEALRQQQGIHADLPAMRSVGYRQLWEYLEQGSLEQVVDIAGSVGTHLSLDEAVERAKIATRQLAKRQLTWLRGWPDLQTVNVETHSDAAQVVGERCLQAVNTFLYPGSAK